jgi:predicted nucleic-acid-binding Zn-ribbon protein
VDLQEQFATRFTCPKCQRTGAETKRIATTGAGISKILDIEHNQFVTVSCRNCGYTEVYNPEMLEGKKTLGSILDVLFGG